MKDEMVKDGFSSKQVTYEQILGDENDQEVEEEHSTQNTQRPRVGKSLACLVAERGARHHEQGGEWRWDESGEEGRREIALQSIHGLWKISLFCHLPVDNFMI